MALYMLQKQDARCADTSYMHNWGILRLKKMLFGCCCCCFYISHTYERHQYLRLQVISHLVTEKRYFYALIHNRRNLAQLPIYMLAHNWGILRLKKMLFGCWQHFAKILFTGYFKASLYSTFRVLFSP